MRKSNITASIFQILLAMAGIYISFAPYFLFMDSWSLLLAILVIVNLAVWPVNECLPKLSMLTSLSSDLTPLLSRVLPRAFIGIALGSLLVTFQYDKTNPLTDLVSMSFLLFTVIYVYGACFIYQAQFDETTLTYKGLLFSGQVQFHEVKEFKKYFGLLYRIKYESKTHQGQIFFLDHFIDRRTIEGDMTTLRKFISFYLNARWNLHENDEVLKDVSTSEIS